MLESHTRQIDTTGMKRAKKQKNNQEETKQNYRLGMASNEITGGWGEGGSLQLVCGRPTLALSSALVPQTVVRFAWKIPSS